MVTDLTLLTQAAAPTRSSTLTVTLAILGSSVVAGLIGTLLGNTRANAAARRERYAQAVRTLVAWAEYPYRIRRRTSDDAATLTALADRGHTLQEQLAESRAWIAAESRAMSEVYDACLREISALAGPASKAAWQAAPITKSIEMVLVDFGPRGIDAIVARMECAIIYRFGLRRMMWRSWVLSRLRHRECLPAVSRAGVERSRTAPSEVAAVSPPSPRSGE